MALCPRHRQARHRHSLASESISIVLDLESPTRQARAPGDITGRSRTDPPHEPRESRLGSTPHSRRTLEAWHRYRRDEREQVPRPQAKATVTDLAHVLAESFAKPRFRRFLHRAHYSLSGPVCVPGASA